jgi:hypothetical protein
MKKKKGSNYKKNPERINWKLPKKRRGTIEDALIKHEQRYAKWK